MKKLLLLSLFISFFSCSSEKDDTNDDLILGWADSAVYYLPQNTRIVAVSGNNILVRGSFPLTNPQPKTFVYEDILNALKEKLPALDLSNHTLIDISVLDNKNELPQLIYEMGCFGLTADSIPVEWPPYINPDFHQRLMGITVSGHSGKFLWWPFKTCSCNDNSGKITGKYFTNDGYDGQAGGFNFDGLVDKIHELMTDDSYPKIIYYHCAFGRDRTGVLTFGYLVKHGGYSKENAYIKVDSIFAIQSDYKCMAESYWNYTKIK